MFKSILWAERLPVREALMPNFFIDLNLDQVVFKINSLVKKADVRKQYYMMPESVEDTLLRRGVLCDVKKDEVFQKVLKYCEAIKDMEEWLLKSEESDFKSRRNTLFVSAAKSFTSAINTVSEIDLELIESDRLKLVLTGIINYRNSDKFIELNRLAEELSDKQSELSYRIILKRDTYTIKAEKSVERYTDKLDKIFGLDRDKGFESPFSHRKDLSHMETVTFEELSRKNPEFIRSCDEFYNKFEGFNEACFSDLEFELQYYISFVIFERYMEENGFGFTKPQTSDVLKADGVYDIGLALKLFKHESPVIDNRVLMDENEKFLVVTGPNQGGKTTFARSIGQMIYFNMMGLDVAAGAAEIPFFSNILTHFSVEESTETGQGKLKEELSRLAPMMDGNYNNCFVILNELFTTAATYDANIMGQRVMKRFMDENCKGIYVTHIKELTGVENVVSLVAVCDENDHHKRLYKMVRKPAEGIGYAGTIVEKHRLTLEDLNNRFKESGLVNNKA